MGRRVAFIGLLLAAIAILFLCFSSPASAADPVPGGGCGTGGYITNSFMWAGAPENNGVTNGMFCNGSTWAGVITFKSSGNVGIGTTSPTAKLDVYGNVSTYSAPTYHGDLLINGNSGGLQSESQNGGLEFYAATGGSGYGWRIMNPDLGSNNVPLIFQYRTGGSPLWNDLITMRSDTGYVGIGTATPSAALQVVGDIKYSGIISDVSDRRLKKDIQPLAPGQLAKIMQLQPVSFVMKDDPKGRTELGLIAQDTEPLYPDLVQTDPDGSKSLNYVGLAAPLIEAMQEQQAEIDRLQAVLAVVFCIALVPGFLLWRNRTK
jgi:hypothetical protein